MRTNNKKKNSIMYSIHSLLMLVMLTGMVRGDVSLDVFSFDEGEDCLVLIYVYSKPRNAVDENQDTRRRIFGIIQDAYCC